MLATFTVRLDSWSSESGIELMVDDKIRLLPWHRFNLWHFLGAPSTSAAIASQIECESGRMTLLFRHQIA
jgi:hypothetical protein